MQNAIALRRKLSNGLMSVLMTLAAILVILPLIAVLAEIVVRGAGSLNWKFFTNIPAPVGEPGGGMANGIVGSAMVLLVASCIGIPLGIGSGIFLSEHRHNPYGNLIRFTADVLNGVPSIVIGIAVYALIVIRQRHFSLFSGEIGRAHV